LDPKAAGVSEEEWQQATASCVVLRVSRIVEETHDARSIVFEIPDDLRERFRYKAGQFLSFKVPFEGSVLTRSYSLSSSPDVDSEHKVTIKRVDDGRVSNLLNDEVSVGTALRVVPPAGLFVLNDRDSRAGHCGLCAFKDYCGGCRARADAYFGTLDGPDPGCIFNARHWAGLTETQAAIAEPDAELGAPSVADG